MHLKATNWGPQWYSNIIMQILIYFRTSWYFNTKSMSKYFRQPRGYITKGSRHTPLRPLDVPLRIPAALSKENHQIALSGQSLGVPLQSQNHWPCDGHIYRDWPEYLPGPVGMVSVDTTHCSILFWMAVNLWECTWHCTHRVQRLTINSSF